ncbi:hypothetical protein GCM10022223_66960 [Kineosporia mesophila]|uniref:Uncharacterized protein n=1 Tax=Kineosporia mesophila TaxID=566012 RepID=A0ABP7ARN5_9ACTN
MNTTGAEVRKEPVYNVGGVLCLPFSSQIGHPTDPTDSLERPGDLNGGEVTGSPAGGADRANAVQRSWGWSPMKHLERRWNEEVRVERS